MYMHKGASVGAGAIFDFDGTLVDSYSPRRIAHRRIAGFLLDNLGVECTTKNRGIMSQIISKLDAEMNQMKKYNRDLWWNEAATRYLNKDTELSQTSLSRASTLYWETLKEKSTVYPGVKSTLRTLRRKGIKIGVVSDTDGLKGMKAERIQASGLSKFFDATVVSGEETTEVKPHSEPFALISKRLGIRPERCVSVGDNPATDVEGGLNIGMKVLIVKNKKTGGEKEPKEYYIVDRKRLTNFIIRLLEQN
jgi:HAD superfamily hydrolase (TIGR01549 family)